MFKIRKGDLVQARTGKDSGKRGKVITVFPEAGRALVEGVNTFKKHKRKTRQDQQGGIVSVESPVRLSNLMVVCKRCDRPVKVGFQIGKDSQKVRICKSCKEVV